MDELKQLTTRAPLLVLFAFFFPLTVLAQEKEEEPEEKQVTGYFDQGVFYSPGAGTPFFETYVRIDGSSLNYEKDANGVNRSKLEVTVIVKDEDSIVDFDKTLTEVPPPTDSSQLLDMVDVKRFALEPGYYGVKVQLKDLHADSVREFSIHSEVALPDHKMDSLLFSDIQLVSDFQKSTEQSAYTKSGIRLIPYAAHYFPPKVEELSFYSELYNSKELLGDTGKFVLRYYLYDRDRKKVMSDYHQQKLRKVEEVAPLMARMGIEELPTGNYDLVLEARDMDNELLTRRSTFIQRHGEKGVDEERLLKERDKLEDSFVSEMNDEDSLRMYIRSLAPVSNTIEKDLIRNQVEVMDMETMKRFMFGFWHERDPERPEQKWKEYKMRVDHVNDEYGGSYKLGFDTDRGRTVLKYGRPDQIVERKNKTHSYPYEIWQYYKIGNYNNKRFVFYNTDLSTQDYDLLHSDMPGELRNRRWRRDLQDRQNVMDDVDQEDVFDHYGREVDDIFRNP